MQNVDYSIGPTLLNKIITFNDFFLTSAKHRTIKMCVGRSILNRRL